MLVINHCGVSNAVYHTSRFPRPYSALVDAEGSLSLDYQPAGADFAALKEAIQYSLDLKKDRRELHPWQDEFARLSTISHVVTVHDRRAGTFTVLLDGVSEYRNWMFVYMPTSIYEDASGMPPRVLGDGEGESVRYRRGHDHRTDVRITGGSHCWRLYYGCNFCGAYSAQPRVREYRFSAPDGVNGCRVFYYVRAPSVKCPECNRISHAGTHPESGERLGKSDIVIFCRFDRTKWNHMDVLLTKDDTAWLTDPTSVVPFMGTVNQGLSIPADLAQFGVSNTTTQVPEHKYRRMLREPGTLSSYHDIPPHWLSRTQFDWAQALSPFSRPDPWATPSTIPSAAVPPSDPGQGEDRAPLQPANSPTSYWPPDTEVARPPSPASTRGIPPGPGDGLSQEEESVKSGPRAPTPTLPHGGLPPPPEVGAPPHSRARRSVRLIESRGMLLDFLGMHAPSKPPRHPARKKTPRGRRIKRKIQ